MHNLLSMRVIYGDNQLDDDVDLMLGQLPNLEPNLAKSGPPSPTGPPTIC